MFPVPYHCQNRVGLGTPDRQHGSERGGAGIAVPSVVPPGGVVLGPGHKTNLPNQEQLSPDGQHRGTECWLHETCLVWLPGVHVTNSKMCGLEEAVIAAQQSVS